MATAAEQHLPEQTVAQHTPGPWVVDAKRKLRVVTDADAYWPHDSVTVATTGCDESQRASWEANAALIAAAPELLAALEAIVTADRDGELCNDQIAQAITAIAKATGAA